MKTELETLIEEVAVKWHFEFDTPENRLKYNSEVKAVINAYIQSKRDEKIDRILK